MRSTVAITILFTALSLILDAQAQEPDAQREVSLFQTNTWWNLYFSTENSPLQRGRSSIHAVKVLEVDKDRPSWIKITFPRRREDHFSIIGAVARAQDGEDLSIETALTQWEGTISEWRVMWINLDAVAYATKVGHNVGGSGDSIDGNRASVRFTQPSEPD